MAFHVGQKVVCVDATNFRNPHLSYLTNGKYPCLGMVYTIRGFTPSAMILLEGMHCAPYSWTTHYGEGGWLPWRFRPVIEKSTDTGMAILREILDRETVKDDKPIKVSQTPL